MKIGRDKLHQFHSPLVERDTPSRVDQVTRELRDRTTLDHRMTGFHYSRLFIALQCNPRLNNIGRNQSHPFNLPPDDEVSHLDKGRWNKGRPKDGQTMLHLGHEDLIFFKIKCSIEITNSRCHDGGIERRGIRDYPCWSKRDKKYQASRRSHSNLRTSRLSRSLCYERDWVD